MLAFEQKPPRKSEGILPEMSAIKLETALWIGLGLAVSWLLILLGPILAPFVLAAILAYICNPLVERLDRRLPRAAAALLVMLLLAGATLLLGLILLPLLRGEAAQILARLPALTGLINEEWIPWLEQHLHLRLKFQLSPDEIQQLLAANWDNVQTVVGKLLGSAAAGGLIAMQILAVLLLTPVAMFYLLRDWNMLVARAENAIPRRWHIQSMRLLREIDQVLAEFLRGQILVMIALAFYYAIALSIAGIHSAILLGVVTGFLVFIPYLGYATGLTLALLAATLQLEGWPPIIGVALAYGIGQALESFLLTPYLVGQRIGLHPLAVIFALLAFGQVFGFFGVLLALPASAAILVGLRELRNAYLASRFYRDAP